MKKQENKEEKLILTNLSQLAEITFPGEPRQFDSYTKPFKKNNLKATIRIDGEDLTTLYVDVSKEDFSKAIQEAQKITLPEDLVILIESPDEIFIKNEAGENRVANLHRKEES